MAFPEVAEAIRQRREFMRKIAGRAPRRRLRGPLPQQRQPDHIRLRYYADIRSKILQPAHELVKERLYPELKRIVESATRGDARADAGGKDANRIIDGISGDFFDGIGDNELDDLAEKYAKATSDFQRDQLGRQMQAAVGVQVPINDRRLKGQVNHFTAENVGLITTIPERYFGQLKTKLLRDIAEGKRWEQIADDLEERYDVSESTAKLIASDQVGKFYGALNEIRQVDLGLMWFIWRSMNDNRVREAHVHLNGKRYEWARPPDEETGRPADPSEGVIPGEPVLCRCYAEPDVNALIAELRSPREDARASEVITVLSIMRERADFASEVPWNADGTLNDSLGIARIELPQIQSSEVPGFLRTLRDAGVTVEGCSRTVGTLRPMQAAVDLAKVAKLAAQSQEELGLKPILVSSDSFILDGHHRWAALYSQGRERWINTYVVNLTGPELLAAARGYAGAFYADAGWEDIPRDEAGRWTSGGGGGELDFHNREAGLKAAATRRANEAARKALAEAASAGNVVAPPKVQTEEEARKERQAEAGRKAAATRRANEEARAQEAERAKQAAATAAAEERAREQARQQREAEEKAKAEAASREQPKAEEEIRRERQREAGRKAAETRRANAEKAKQAAQTPAVVEPEKPAEPPKVETPPPAPNSNGQIQGKAGKYAAQTHPRVAEKLGNKLFVIRHEKESLDGLNKIPDGVHEALVADGVNISLGGTGMLDGARAFGPEHGELARILTHQRVPGALGIYASSTRDIVIKKGSFSEVVIHEVGHAIDYSAGRQYGVTEGRLANGETRFSNTPEFLTAFREWRADANKVQTAEFELARAKDKLGISQWAEPSSHPDVAAKHSEVVKLREQAGQNHKHPYFTRQPRMEGNHKETFAESFGYYYDAGGGESGEKKVRELFGPHIAKYIRGKDDVFRKPKKG